MNHSYNFLSIVFLIIFSLRGYSQSVPSYVPTNGLVGWWGFNGNAQDGSGNGNHGTINGATLTSDRFGIQNGAYSFDGIDDRIDLPLNLNGALLNLSQFTLTGFILKNSTDERTFFSNWKSFPLSDPFGINCAIGPGIKAGNCSGTGVSTTNQIILGEWYNVSIVYDGLQSNALNRIKLFINGYQQLSDSGLTVYSPFVVSSSLGNQATHTAFGSHFSQFGWWAHLDGKLDDIGIWNRALTQQEISNLYNSQLPTQTSLCLPTITTNTPTFIGIDSVLIGGDILNDGGISIVLRGVCYSTTPNPNMGNTRTEEGSGIGSFTSTLRNLIPSTTYYARSYAKNSQGVVVYGNEVSFSTGTPIPGIRCPGTPSVTDIDGNMYHTVQIGTQCWTQSNLKTSKYRNWDTIPTGLSNSDWRNTQGGAYAMYDNESLNDSLFGKLYNYNAISDSRGLCPTGWHIPFDIDWSILENQLGGSSVAGGHIKSTATQPNSMGWLSPNIGATNSSGFSALPGGYRNDYGFQNIYLDGMWWSASSYNGSFAFNCRIHSHSSMFSRSTEYRFSGLSARCLKNTPPKVNSPTVINVTNSTAIVTSEVLSDGGDYNTTRGFCYALTSNPTTNYDTTIDGTGLGIYSRSLQNLIPSSTYYVRSYATNSLGTTYSNQVIFTTDSILQIGQFYAGGYIFYIDSTGQHGLVCAPINQVDLIYWGNPLGVAGWGCQGGNVLINNGTEFGTSQQFGTGLQNTLNILNSCPYRPIAASLCDELVLNGYSDWYLPSLDELLLMYNLKVQGIGNFNNYRYWSSSQHNQSLSVSSYYSFNRYAYAVDFSNGNYSVFEKTNQPSLTRAIRNF